MAHKVGLLTLHLHTNYGGILQVAALYQFLARNGKQPLLLRKKPVRSRLQRLMVSVLKRIPGQNVGGARLSERARTLHYPFIRRFMPDSTGELRTSGDFRKATRRHGLEAVIVGSDQVWRFEYHADAAPMTFMLDFIDPVHVRGISYAASFGHSSWTYPDLTKRTRELLGRFHAVSVRETSGAAICHDTLGRTDAVVTLDPTLLVDPAFYDEATARSPVYTGRKIVSYVLDQNEDKQDVARQIAALIGDNVGEFSLLKTGGAKLDIPQWLRAIRDAEFVITDSFHGMVFCILFRKNFVVIPNLDRGVDRFTTLLGDLGLLDRLLTNQDDLAAIVSTPVDYAEPYNRLIQRRQQSADFLLSALA